MTRNLMVLAAGLATLAVLQPGVNAARPPMADPALDRLATLVGGRWTHDNGKGFTVAFRYELAMNGKAVRATGVVNKGTPNEFSMESMYGWDPIQKKAYYIDFHGHDTVYKGTVTLQAESLLFDFTTLVGDPDTYKARLDFLNKDTFKSVILGKKDGKWISLHEMEFKRHQD